MSGNIYTLITAFVMLILVGTVITFLIVRYIYKLNYGKNKKIYRDAFYFSSICGIIIGRVSMAITGIMTDRHPGLIFCIAYLITVSVITFSVINYNKGKTVS